MSTHTKPLNAAAQSPTRGGNAGQRQVLLPIVRIVLTQAARFRQRGAITQQMFESQIRRLAREELEPRGLELLVRDLPCGTTRYVVKTKITGMVCDMVDCPCD